MNRAKIVMGIMLALALAWVQSAMAPSAGAQAIKLVPSNALVVYKVSDLQVTSKKVADFLGTLGLVQMNPDLADPLGMLLKQMGVTAGVNKAGDLAFAMIDPDAVGGNVEQSLLILFPVSDYAAFLGNFQGNTTTGDITQVQFKNDVNPSFVAHWGDYAAISPSKTLVATQPTSFLVLGDLAAKEMDVKDFVIYANVKALRPKALTAIDKLRVEAMAQIDQATQKNSHVGTVDIAKVSPVLKVVVNQALTLGLEFVNDVDDATLSSNLSPDGIGTTALAEFAPDSKLGKMILQGKNTDASLLSGIPDGKYLVFGGGIFNPAISSQFIGDFLDPIQKSITDLGPDFAPFNDLLAAVKTMVGTQTGGRFAVIAPAGALGQEPLLQFFSTRSGDSKTLLAAQHQMVDAWTAAMKSLGITQAGSTTTVTSAAKTLDGVTFDLFQTSFDMQGQNMQQQQAMQFITFIYGPNGMQQYVGPVNADSLLTVSGMSDPAISGAIAAIKSGDDPLAKSPTVKAVAAELPPERQGVVYLPLDLWASTGLNYAKQFSMDMGVKIPEDLPPVGITGSTQGSAMRYDAYIPSQLVQALTSAGMQIYMASRQPPPGSTPGGL